MRRTSAQSSSSTIRQYSQVGVPLTCGAKFFRFLEVHDLDEVATVSGERRPPGEQDEVERSVFVLISELDGRLALAR